MPRPSTFSNLNHAESATTILSQFRMIAQSGYINTVVLGGLEYIRTFGDTNKLIVYRNIYHIYLIAIKLHLA